MPRALMALLCDAIFTGEASQGVLNARERQCLRAAVGELRMDGIGLVAPVTLLIDIEVGE
jgi:hypothetical protein